MSQSLELFSINLFYMIRGALLTMSILMCISLYPKQKNNPILQLLFWALVSMSVLVFLFSIAFMVDSFRNNEQFISIRILVDLCFIPMIYSLLLKIIIPDKINFQKTLLVSSPSIISLIIYMFIYNEIMLTFSFIYTGVFGILALLLITFISIRYDNYIKNNFSNIDNKTVKWVRIVMYLFAIWYVLWALKTKLGNRWLDSAFFLLLIIIWGVIYTRAKRHLTTFHTQELFEDPKDEAVDIETINKNFDFNLEHYMNDECAWLNPSLTLQELALALNTNRTYLSEYFNKTLNTNFYDYLNSYRIKYACEILLAERNLSIVQVGEKAGFNSLSTFQRAFDKHMGCTPAKYRKLNIEE